MNNLLNLSFYFYKLCKTTDPSQNTTVYDKAMMLAKNHDPNKLFENLNKFLEIINKFEFSAQELYDLLYAVPAEWLSPWAENESYRKRLSTKNFLIPLLDMIEGHGLSLPNRSKLNPNKETSNYIIRFLQAKKWSNEKIYQYLKT